MILYEIMEALALYEQLPEKERKELLEAARRMIAERSGAA